jgi:hypothetical protein
MLHQTVQVVPQASQGWKVRRGQPAEPPSIVCSVPPLAHRRADPALRVADRAEKVADAALGDAVRVQQVLQQEQPTRGLDEPEA